MASTSFNRTNPPSFKTNAALLATKVLKGRWFMLYACFLIMTSSGATYIFGIYSKDIKSSLNYNQQTLNTLSFFKDLGANVGILSGLINEISPPFVVLLLGSFMNLFGYLMIYFSITARLPCPAVWQMCLYICVGANSQSFANTGALVTAVKNFPASRGIVLGLLKCFVGLSGAIFTQLYLAFYGGDDSKSLVLLVAWLPAAVSLVFVYTVRVMEPERGSGVGDSAKPFYYFLYFAVALGGYLMVVIVVEKVVSFSRAEMIANGAVVILLLVIPVAVVVKEEVNRLKQSMDVREQRRSSIDASCEEEANQRRKTITDQQSIAGASSGEEETKIITEHKIISHIIEIFSPPARGEDYSILQALFSIDMLILFFSTICGVGGTLTAIDNMGQIGESLGYPSRSINTFVSLISIWNAMGRVAAGFISEILLTKYKFPRPLMLTVVLLLACSGHLLIAFGVPNSLYIASVIIGFCFGAQWPLLFAIISELFGLKYYSTLYNFGGVASPIGSYILNVRVAGYLYDREAEKQSSGGKEVTCVGVKCFQLSFLIITAATVIGAIVSLVLAIRTKKFYKGDIYARFRKEAPEEAMERGSSADKLGERRMDGGEIIREMDFTVR